MLSGKKKVGSKRTLAKMRLSVKTTSLSAKRQISKKVVCIGALPLRVDSEAAFCITSKGRAARIGLRDFIDDPKKQPTLKRGRVAMTNIMGESERMAAVCRAAEEDEIFILSAKGKLLCRASGDFALHMRFEPAKGEKAIKLRNEDRVAAVANWRNEADAEE